MVLLAGVYSRWRVYVETLTGGVERGCLSSSFGEKRTNWTSKPSGSALSGCFK